jgi:hypothetical protein
MDETDRHTATLSRTVLAMLRRIFRRCQGRPVNAISREMTPEEAVELQARMSAHGMHTTDDDESRDETPHRQQAIR